MEKTTERLKITEQALQRLHEYAGRSELSPLEKSGLVKHFEFGFELLWKCGKDYLADREGIVAASPKRVIRALREVGMFDDAETETLLQIADDRNLSAHTYNEDMAMALAERVVEYETIMQTWYRRLIA